MQCHMRAHRSVRKSLTCRTSDWHRRVSCLLPYHPLSRCEHALRYCNSWPSGFGTPASSSDPNIQYQHWRNLPQQWQCAARAGLVAGKDIRAEMDRKRAAQRAHFDSLGVRVSGLLLLDVHACACAIHHACLADAVAPGLPPEGCWLDRGA